MTDKQKTMEMKLNAKLMNNWISFVLDPFAWQDMGPRK